MDAKFQWQLADSIDQATQDQLAKELKLLPITAKILVNRGYQTAEAIDQFLHPQIENCYDPFLMHDMQRAVERIQSAIEQGQKITVYGDYDADGITSTSLMYETLLTVGADVDYYVPNRFTDGYGPNVQAFNRLIDNGTQLIVTVDNGVSGNEAIAAAQQRNVDVVVTDHHELPQELPTAYAIVHPRFPGSKYPFGDLSGVGVAFKVAWALLEEFPTELLDLVAIGEVADLVSVTDENRILITYGIQQLRTGMRPGIHELVKLAGINEQTINETNIGFGIAPRLNALGRMGDANPGVELLTTLDDEAAGDLAKMVDTKNQDRQKLVSDISDEALQQAQTAVNQERNVLVLSGHDWHQGVLGIVASRVVEQLEKPAIVMNIDDETGLAKGSGRSIDGFDLFQAVDGLRDLTEAFGGHQMAIGLTVPVANVAQLVEQLQVTQQAQQLATLAKAPMLIAGQLSAVDANLTLFNELEQLAPFGTGNPRPQFLFQNQLISDVKQIGKNNDHLKLAIGDEDTKLAAIAFGKGELAPELQAAVDQVEIVGTLDENEWRGNRSIQLMIKDLKTNGIAVIDERTNNLSAPLFQGNDVYICFDQQVIDQLQPQVNATLILAASINSAMLQQQTVTLVDCPPSLDALKAVFKVGGTPTAVRVFAYQKDDAYLMGMPTRQEFGMLYKFVQTHQNVDVHRQLGTLSGFLKIDRNKLIFMIQLFFEVGFVKIEDGVLNGVVNPPSVELTSADLYQKRQQLIETEKALVYSNSKDLKHWVLQCVASD